MEISKNHLKRAVEQNILSSSQADNLFDFLQAEVQHKPAFSFTHILYYLGGMIAIGAMTLFMNMGWETFGGAGIVFIALLYACAGLTLTRSFDKKQLLIPAGICATFVVCLTPLAVYGFQQWLGVWPDNDVTYTQYHFYIKWHWLYMELATLMVGIVMAWYYRYPFLVMPIALTLWYMSMDVVSVLEPNEYSWALRALVSMYFGLLMTLLAVWVDIRARKTADFAFWIYLFGVIAFWGGLSSQESQSEWSKFLYFVINLAMIGVGALLVRKVFVIFGALGCCGYLGHLASNVFEGSWLFPVALSVIGLAVIYFGILWQKHEAALTTKARSIMPASLRELLEAKD